MSSSRLVTFDDFAVEIGKNVRRARSAANLTLEEVAAKVMTYGRLSQLENGKGNPTAATILSLATLFKVRPEDLLTVGKPPKGYVPLASRDAEPPKLGRRSNK